MSEGWTFGGESASLGQVGGTVTLVEGSAFCISGRTGDVAVGTPQGMIFRDVRFVSRLEVRIDGWRIEPLSATPLNPFSCRFVGRTRPRPGRADSTLLVVRDRYLGRGMREDISLHNFEEEPVRCRLEVLVDADFAGLFEVKEGRVTTRPGTYKPMSDDGEIVFESGAGRARPGLRVSFSEAPRVDGGVATFDLVVEPSSSWSTCVEFTPRLDGGDIVPSHRCGEPNELATPVERLARWRRSVPVVRTDHQPLQTLVEQSAEDLGALRIFDPDHPERTVVAAGAPWFMTLFGRDSILTSWMALIVDPDLALGVLQTLARFQGTEVDPHFDEEPGRILHEIRFGDAVSLGFGDGNIYYGSVDSTPLFVMLLGELDRWGLAPEVVDRLLPHADRALQWIDEYGDRDGDGYVEYHRLSEHGLVNQGWKDSHDGIRFADGELARAPIALCEVQGYVYAAYLARAHFAAELGDHETAVRYRDRAIRLKEAFNRDFWLDDRGWFAMGLDDRKRKIDALASNMGHCLWTGIVDEDKAAIVAQRLVSDELFSGWGVRTLATSMVGYNPISYHNGSVWPHDNALTAAGLMRYGFVEEAHRVITAMIDAGVAQGARLPELFAGLERTEFPRPVPYPTSCSPQAWAAASPLLFLRILLRLEPWVPHDKVWVAPALPAGMRRLRVERIPLGGRRVTITVDGDDVDIEGLPPELAVVHEPRPPGTSLTIF